MQICLVTSTMKYVIPQLNHHLRSVVDGWVISVWERWNRRICGYRGTAHHLPRYCSSSTAVLLIIYRGTAHHLPRYHEPTWHLSSQWKL